MAGWGLPWSRMAWALVVALVLLIALVLLVEALPTLLHPLVLVWRERGRATAAGC